MKSGLITIPIQTIRTLGKALNLLTSSSPENE